MKCDKVIPALAAGGFFGRWRARGMPPAARAVPRLSMTSRSLVGELSAVPALTPAERQLWLRACDQVPSVSRFWPGLARPALAAAVIAAVVIPVGIWLSSHR